MRELLDYFRTYERVDVALDSFPYAGGTTTCDAIWMGVPTITLAGRIAVHRGGVSLLRNVGLDDLIASSDPALHRRRRLACVFAPETRRAANDAATDACSPRS
jgi:predicted O-linked N-acetylglucosamine transferase (SPINDLY family)